MLNIRSRRILAVVSLVFMLAGCGEDKELAQFKTDIDTFCVNISMIDTEINHIDTSSDNYTTELLSALDRLDAEFKAFAALDFPEDYNYLEPAADEASEYMTEAVRNFRDAYTNDSYDEDAFKARYKYARDNYSMAYKRIQIIISFLHGEEPEDVIIR